MGKVWNHRGLCWDLNLSWQVLLGLHTKVCDHGWEKTNATFNFVWSTALAHEGLNDGRMGDEHLLTTLKCSMMKDI
ncbi:hypothetical protein Ocin01_14751 [Orchesella cincta]|uniref:Uncharacterized protein n=1 Tax=Orchesella cincta TaxID=48709 RepID=A0A1D2MG16_ORCCI|nr:hypothetical protein Ocin01_14751 [Orchesella cincta]